MPRVTFHFSPLKSVVFFIRTLSVASWLLLPQKAVIAAPLRMEPADSPVDNPMKGLVPYAGKSAERFPHSLEFDYLPLSKLLTGPGQYNWKPLDDKLVAISGRSCQAVFRIWLEFPGQSSGLPDYLAKAGVKVTEWKEAGEKSPKSNFTPDYEDEELVVALEGFIAALGQRYDGDARVGFLTAGLLGLWGEWHTYPRTELFASKRTQERILAAYERAFHRVPVLLRYPAAPDNHGHAMKGPLVGNEDALLRTLRGEEFRARIRVPLASRTEQSGGEESHSRISVVTLAERGNELLQRGNEPLIFVVRREVALGRFLTRLFPYRDLHPGLRQIVRESRGLARKFLPDAEDRLAPTPGDCRQFVIERLPVVLPRPSQQFRQRQIVKLQAVRKTLRRFPGIRHQPLQLEPADSPVDNPMKGLVPYAGKSAERFPHSLEFDYLPLAKLLTGPGQYDWKLLDDKLVAISGRAGRSRADGAGAHASSAHGL